MKDALSIWCRAILALVTVPTWAQDKSTDTMRIVRDKIRAAKELFVADNMQLTASEAKAFWLVYDSYQRELSTLNDRMIKLIEDYATNDRMMSDQVAKRLVDAYLAVEAEWQKLRQSHLPSFRKVLREKPVARYSQIANQVEAAVSYELAAEIP